MYPYPQSPYPPVKFDADLYPNDPKLNILMPALFASIFCSGADYALFGAISITFGVYLKPFSLFSMQIMCRFNAHFSWVQLPGKKFAGFESLFETPELKV